MKKLFSGMAMLMFATPAMAQYQQKASFQVDATLQQKTLEWVDVDNDGALDILVFSTDSDGLAFIEAYRNEGSNFVFRSISETQMTEANFYVTDYDLDNHIDVLVSGMESGESRTKALLSNGDFVFTASDILEASGKTLGLADLNMDGGRELILSDDNPHRIRIYQQESGGWNLINDSLSFHASYLFFHDFNRDFYTDILLSGERQDGTPVQLVLANEKGFAFDPLPELGSIRDAALTEADLNGDGEVDILISGTNAASQPASSVVYGNGSLNPLVSDTTLASGVVRNLFAADMTSDGQADINVMSSSGGDIINVIRVTGQGEVNLPSQDLIAQRFGDADGDGDLDLMQLLPGETVLFENTTGEINEGPVKPASAFAALIYDRLFVYWTQSGDDHTPVSSITYDVTLQGPSEEIMVGEFDLIGGLRTKVSHGNVGFDNFILLKDMVEGGYGFLIQGVDNAFHVSTGGICEGQTMPCEFTSEDVTACSGEAVHLETQGESLWFSFADGYLGRSGTYTYKAAGSDTLFSVTPSAGLSCAALKVYNFQRNDSAARNESDIRYACSGSTLYFETPDSWDYITWSSSVRGFISNEPSIEFPVTVPDTVILELANAAGCSLVRKTAIVVSEPQALIGDTTYQILKGQSVQLHAAVEGGVSYSWQPSTGLSQSDVPNPVATPATTTEYVVTIADSIGCTFQSRVMILVENTAFVPTLFTPNQDGKNDNLKLYGLESAGRFSFRIYNREGNLVFQADDLAEVSQGWDGSAHGVIQPAGIYHWKIEGEDTNGKRLLLNGKKTGSFVLIR